MSYKQLMDEIKNNSIKNIYLIYGTEAYLIEKAWDNLKKAVVTDFPEMNYTLMYGEGLKSDQLSMACETFPFGVEKRLVVVRDLALFRPGSKAETGAEDAPQPTGDMQSYIGLVANMPETTCLLFVCYGNIDKRKKIVNEIKKHGGLYEFNKVERDNLTKWISGTLGRNKKKIGPRELDYFIQCTGYLDKNSSKTLYDLENELSKLESFMGDEVNVSRTHIDAVVPKNPENDIFKLINACSERKVSDCLKVYNDLLLEGESSLGVLALLSRQIKNMIGAVELSEKGVDSRGVADRLKIHEYTAKLCVKYGAAIKRAKLEAAFRRCLETENGIKTGKLGERLALELLLVGLFE